MSVTVPIYPFETEPAVQLPLSSEMSRLLAFPPAAEDDRIWPGKIGCQSEDLRELWYWLLRRTPV